MGHGAVGEGFTMCSDLISYVQKQSKVNKQHCQINKVKSSPLYELRYWKWKSQNYSDELGENSFGILDLEPCLLVQ